MSLIREHINEKFKQDSDPIDDLNIGLKPEIEKWYEEVTATPLSKKINWDDEDCVHHAFALAAFHSKYEYILYLLNKGVDIHYLDEVALRNAAWKGKNDMIVFLIKHGADIDKAIENSNQTRTRENLMNVKKQLHKYLNEKFTDDSDPIKDLGIGYDQYKPYVRYLQVENILNALDGSIKGSIVDSFNAPYLNGVYYLCSSYAESHCEEVFNVLNKIKKVTNNGKNKTYEEDLEMPNGVNVRFIVYETEIGKIGELIYGIGQRESPTHRYIGDIVAVVELYEVRKNMDVIY